MSDLPPGFVLDGSASAGNDLPPGFTVDGGAPAAKPSFGLADTWPVRMAKAAWSGLTLPGDVVQGSVSMTGEDGRTNPQVISRAAELAMASSPASPAAGTGAAIAATVGLAKPATLAVAPTREALLQAANKGYDSARNLGVDISSDAVSGLSQRIQQSLFDQGVSDKLAPKTFSVLSEAAAPPSGSVASISNLDTIRRSLGHAARDFSNPTEQLAAKTAQGHLDDYLAALPVEDVIRGPAPEASKILSEARGNYAAAKRSERVTDAIDAADLQAAAANSGQNIGNATRQRLKSILTSDKQSAGYTGEELAQMEQVVRGTGLGNSTRMAGNILGGGGGLGAVASAAVGGAATGGWGAVAPLVGFGLKKISDASVNRGVSTLDEMVRLRSPLAEALLKNTQTQPQAVSTQNAAIARFLLNSQPQYQP